MSKKPFAITLDPKLSLNNKTGSWRNRKPVYVNRLPPCNATCPAGENIQLWLSKVQEGDIKGAWNEIVQNNPFPACMGRVCYHPCESVCNRNHLDSQVNINMIEKFVGNEAIREGWKFDFSKIQQTGKKVLVVGAGPAGLSAAFFLRRCGHFVCIVEANSKAGGMFRYGIPSYRLSREVLDAEIDRILATGVELRLGEKVEDLRDYLGKYDAIFIACGACSAVQSQIPASGNRVYDAIDLLKRLENREISGADLGKHVIVYGGGNTAIDVARTALRLGCEDVKIVYRRELEKMTAHKTEIEEALQEGVKIVCLRSITSIRDNFVIAENLKLLDNVEYVSDGKLEEIAADSVVFAIGQKPELKFLQYLNEVVYTDKGEIVVDDNMMTGHRGIFAGGDVVPSRRTVTAAIAHGKKVARCIDALLNNTRYVPCEKNEIVTFKKLNFNYYVKSPGANRLQNISNNFNEYGQVLNNEQSVAEAKRCMSCGNCMSCNNCYAMCPDGAIERNSFGLSINYDYCKGCGICATECPCGAIKMVEEDK